MIKPVDRHLVRRTAGLLGAGVAALFAVNASALITVGPDADTACQFHDVTSAIESADQTPGVDVVAIAAGTYTGVSTAIVSSSDDLIIEGGYASCSAGVPSTTSTLDAAGAVIHGSLIVHIGAGRLTLRHLVLTNGNSSGGGGGVDSEGSGALTLSDVMLLNNSADYGGGIFAIGASNPHKQITLIGTQFNSNTAFGSGGGLYAIYSDIHIDTGGASYFLGNIAQGSIGNTGDGGGFYVSDSNFIAFTHGVAGFPFIGSNLAQRNGGGAYFDARTGGAYEFFLANDTANLPLELSDNSAVEGGAIYMNSASTNSQILSFASLTNTIFRDNRANYAPVASVYGNGQSLNVTTGLRFAQSKVGDASPPCPASLECNLMEGNVANSGYIVTANGSGPEGGAYIEMFRGRMIDNSAIANGSGLIFGGNARLNIDGSLFAQNTLSGNLMSVVGSDLRFANSTAADNFLGASQLFDAALVPATVEILHSLLTQPDEPVDAYLVGAGIPVTVHDVGAQDVNGLPTGSGNNVQFLTDPYVNRANGDFHIRTTSSAVDRWAYVDDPDDPAPTLDLDGAMRPFVFNSPSTPFDFGAYEAGSVADAIFINGFDQ